MTDLFLSYTKIKSLMDCPYSYFLRYIKHVKTLESSYSVFGTAVHETIHLGYENQLTKEEWIKIFKQEWINRVADNDVVFNTEGEYLAKFKEGQQLVSDYHDTFVTKKTKPPQSTELSFGKNPVVKIAGHTLVGKIDQITADGKVVDYKDTPKPNQNQLDFDLQFTVYSYAYRYIFGKEEKALILRHLPTMKDMVTNRTKADFDMMENEIGKFEDIIKHGNFVRNLSRNCANCYFLGACLNKERKATRWNRS
jgi:RecB family exonuclease